MKKKTRKDLLKKQKGFITFGQAVKDTLRDNKSVFYLLIAIVLAFVVFAGLFLYIAAKTKSLPSPIDNNAAEELKRIKKLETGFDQLKEITADLPSVSDQKLEEGFKNLQKLK